MLTEGDNAWWTNYFSVLLRNKMAERFASVFDDESCEKCKIKQLLNSVCAWYHELSKPRVCVICTDLGFDNSWYHAQPHAIIVYYQYFPQDLTPAPTFTLKLLVTITMTMRMTTATATATATAITITITITITIRIRIKMIIINLI